MAVLVRVSFFFNFSKKMDHIQPDEFKESASCERVEDEVVSPLRQSLDSRPLDTPVCGRIGTAPEL